MLSIFHTVFFYLSMKISLRPTDVPSLGLPTLEVLIPYKESDISNIHYTSTEKANQILFSLNLDCQIK
jgi:hypothetical protein